MTLALVSRMSTHCSDELLIILQHYITINIAIVSNTNRHIWNILSNNTSFYSRYHDFQLFICVLTLNCLKNSCENSIELLCKFNFIFFRVKIKHLLLYSYSLQKVKYFKHFRMHINNIVLGSRTTECYRLLF